MFRRLIAALVVLASGCLAPAPLFAQRPSQYVLSIREGVLGASDSTIAAVARVGGAARYNTPVTVVAVVLASKVRDSLWLASDTSRVLVTGPWRRWLEAAEFDGFVKAPKDSTPPAIEDAGSPLSTTWGVNAVGAPAAWAMGARGQGIKVASLDSGIDPNHPGYLVGGGYAAAGGALGGPPATWTDDIPSCNGHGTHVGGTVADRTGRGVAPGAILYGIKVFSDVNGQCLAYTSAQIAGIEWAVANGIRCINVSIGGTSTSAAYQNAIASARNAGVVIAAANGNSGSTPALFPGSADYLLGVASVGSSITRSGFSNYGPTTDLAAPGEGIESTMPGGGYGGKSGTSMATPHVVGVCALVLSERPSLPADSVMEFMRATARPIGSPTPNDYTGWGLVRADRAIAAVRGGLAIAASTTDTIAPTAPLARVCKPVVALRGWSATSDAPWLRVTTSADSLCYVIDPTLLPPGSGTLVATVRTTVDPPAPIGPVITVDLATRYQTMAGWEATAQAGQAQPGFLAWQSELLDSAVALGITRLRIELASGTENTTDYYGQFRAGTITNAAYNAQRYAWVNDNGDPLSANAAGFQWTKMDEAMTQVVVPLRNRLLARGDSLYLSMNYVSFGGSTAQAAPAEWAELVLAAFQHLQARYGFVPDAVEVILEPDNNTIRTGTGIGQLIAAAGPRLAAAGFRPEFIAPSVMNMGNAVAYLNEIAAVPGALTYLREVSYHRYQGVSSANLAGIATRAKALGLRTAMLEHIGSGIDDLLDDVTVGNASAWQQYTLAFPTTDNGAQYFTLPGNRPATGSLTKLLQPVFSAVKRGAVRVGTTSADYTTAAWVNPDGRAAVAVRARSAGAATLLGLPAGRYQVTFAPESGSTTSTTTTITGAYPVTLPAAGLLVVRGIP